MPIYFSLKMHNVHYYLHLLRLNVCHVKFVCKCKCKRKCMHLSDANQDERKNVKSMDENAKSSYSRCMKNFVISLSKQTFFPPASYFDFSYSNNYFHIFNDNTRNRAKCFIIYKTMKLAKVQHTTHFTD